MPPRSAMIPGPIAIGRPRHTATTTPLPTGERARRNPAQKGPLPGPFSCGSPASVTSPATPMPRRSEDHPGTGDGTLADPIGPKGGQLRPSHQPRDQRDDEEDDEHPEQQT